MPKTALIRRTIAALDGATDPSSIHLVYHSDVVSDFSSIGDVINAIVTNFSTPPTGHAHAADEYLSSVMDNSSAAVTYEVYDITTHLDGSPAGAPVAISTHGRGTSISTRNLPDGVAATVSYRADYGTDVEFAPGARPRARDRNRFYFGPLNLSAISDDSITHRTKLDGEFIQVMLKTLFNLSNTVDVSTNQWNLRVWSRKNAAIKLPILGWMDDRPDYQRRRSDATPGSRVSQALSSV